MTLHPTPPVDVRSNLSKGRACPRRVGLRLGPRVLAVAGVGLLAFAAGCSAPPHGTVPVQTGAEETPSPGTTSPPPAVAAPQGDSSVPAVTATARSYLGTPYRYGGASRSGMDCSGLVYRVFRQNGIRLPRTSAEQFEVGEEVAPRGMRSGDLVFFGDGHGHVNHVGIYLGQGRFIHASTGQQEVRVDSLRSGYFQSHFVGARRVATPAR